MPNLLLNWEASLHAESILAGHYRSFTANRSVIFVYKVQQPIENLIEGMPEIIRTRDHENQCIKFQ